jgi:hypothetical protein
LVQKIATRGRVHDEISWESFRSCPIIAHPKKRTRGRMAIVVS